MRVACLQFCPGNFLESNLRVIESLVSSAVNDHGARVLFLPEIATGTYGNEYFRDFTETLGEKDTGSGLFQQLAKRFQIYLGGGVVRRLDGKLWNAYPVYGPEGELLTCYHKLHLSRVKIAQDSTAESDVFHSGEDLNPGVFETEGGFRFGLGICFDLRFQRLAYHRAYRQGCNVLVYPSAFLKSSGQYHWECLLRSRALDNQCYSIGPNQSETPESPTTMYGNSMIVNCFGDVVGRTGATNIGIAVADINIDHIEDIRTRIPLHRFERKALYDGANKI